MEAPEAVFFLEVVAHVGWVQLLAPEAAAEQAAGDVVVQLDVVAQGVGVAPEHQLVGADAEEEAVAVAAEEDADLEAALGAEQVPQQQLHHALAQLPLGLRLLRPGVAELHQGVLHDNGGPEVLRRGAGAGIPPAPRGLALAHLRALGGGREDLVVADNLLDEPGGAAGRGVGLIRSGLGKGLVVAWLSPHREHQHEVHPTRRPLLLLLLLKATALLNGPLQPLRREASSPPPERWNFGRQTRAAARAASAAPSAGFGLEGRLVLLPAPPLAQAPVLSNQEPRAEFVRAQGRDGVLLGLAIRVALHGEARRLPLLPAPAPALAPALAPARPARPAGPLALCPGDPGSPQLPPPALGPREAGDAAHRQGPIGRDGAHRQGPVGRELADAAVDPRLELNFRSSTCRIQVWDLGIGLRRPVLRRPAAGRGRLELAVVMCSWEGAVMRHG
mmetsp:Transcript_25488/g.73169  ORF Transcript_25488/g.73169 Transcript_25488/m.73169 type:complete len:446 (+) Transcript_25488:1977-3314(+)